MKRAMTHEDIVWRDAVLNRDKCCVICGTKQHLEAHHLNSCSYFPEERTVLDNGITLCGGTHNGVVSCHTIFHTSFKRSFRTKCTKEDFDQFIELVERMKVKSIIV